MLALGGLTTASAIANADEGGVGLWVPGFFGSLSATPLVPGASFAAIYYHTSVKAGADVAFARQVNSGRITTNFTGSVNINLRADVDLGLAVPSYTFAQPFLGGQATVLMLVLTAVPRPVSTALSRAIWAWAARASRSQAAAPMRSTGLATSDLSSICAGITAFITT